MAWTKFWDGLWYNDATGEQRETYGDPNEEDAAAMQQKPQWIREGWQIVSGDASGSGVSNTSVINPTTGKAESLIQVASAPDANGIKQDLGTVPLSEFVAMQSADPSIGVARALPSPEDSMLKSSLGSQIMEGIKEVGPIALAMYAGGTGLNSLLASGATDAASLAAVESTGLGGLSGAGMSAADLSGITTGLNIFNGVGLDQVIPSPLTDVGSVIQQELPNVFAGGDPTMGTGEFGQLATAPVAPPPAPYYPPELDQMLTQLEQQATAPLVPEVPYAPPAIPTSPPGTSTLAQQVTTPSTPSTPAPVTPPTLNQVASGAGLAGTVASAAGGTDSDLAQFGTGVSADGGTVVNTGSGVTTGGGTSGSSWNWSDWYKLYQSDPGKALQSLMSSSLGNDIKNGLGSLFAYNQNQDYQKDLIGVMNRAIDVSDPFRAERPFYQGQLKSMYTDPNYWDNSPILKSMKENALRETNASMASQGYNMSGNQIEGLGQTLQRTQAQYALPLINQTGGFAGAGFGPGAAGTTAAATGTAAANAGNAGNMALGNLFNSAWNGVSNPSGNSVSRTGGYMDANGVWRVA